MKNCCDAKDVDDDKIELLRSMVRSYPDFPKPGILFRDIFSVMVDVDGLQLLRELLIDRARRIIDKRRPSISTPLRPVVVVSLESRGFLFGSMIAAELGFAFVPIRKSGKLPGQLRAIEYQLEYGTDRFEVQTDALEKISKDGRGGGRGCDVIIVDDLLATGGSLKAAVDLLTGCGAEIHVVSCLVVMELTHLKGREKLNVPIESLLAY